jgi:hypothetical protein
MNEFHCEFAGLLSSIGLNSGEFPCIFPQNREVRVGDRFADDCPHRQFFTSPDRKPSTIEKAKSGSYTSSRLRGQDGRHRLLNADWNLVDLADSALLQQLYFPAARTGLEFARELNSVFCDMLRSS